MVPRGREEHALYRMFAADGSLLYVGIAVDPGRRLCKHRGEKGWWTEVAKITVEPQPSRRAALDAETAAIKKESPRYNIRKRALPSKGGQPTWREAASRRWPDAVWIAGAGPFALVAHCRARTVTLWDSAERALKSKRLIDETGCGGCCFGDHEIVGLESGEIIAGPDLSYPGEKAEAVLYLSNQRRRRRDLGGIVDELAPRASFVALLSEALRAAGLEWCDVVEELERQRSEGPVFVSLREFIDGLEEDRERYILKAAQRLSAQEHIFVSENRTGEALLWR